MTSGVPIQLPIGSSFGKAGNHLFLGGRARRPVVEASRGTAIVGACREIMKNKYAAHCYFTPFRSLVYK